MQREIDRVHFLSGDGTKAGQPNTLAAPPDPTRCPKHCGLGLGPELDDTIPLPDPPPPADVIAPLLFTNSGTMLDLLA